MTPWNDLADQSLGGAAPSVTDALAVLTSGTHRPAVALVFEGGSDAGFRDQTKAGFDHGASVFHLNEPSVTLFSSDNDRLLRRYTVHAATRITTKRWVVLPKVY